MLRSSYEGKGISNVIMAQLIAQQPSILQY